MRVEKKAFAYRIYSHFTQQCKPYLVDQTSSLPGYAMVASGRPSNMTPKLDELKNLQTDRSVTQTDF